MPAPAISAASVQNGTPTGSVTPATRPTSSANGCPGGASNGSRPTPSRSAASPAIPRSSSSTCSRVSPGIVRRSPVSRQRRDSSRTPARPRSARRAASPARRARGRARLQPLVEALQSDEDGPHPRDRVDAEIRARAVRGDALGLDLEADEAAMGDGELQLGRLDDDRGVGARRARAPPRCRRTPAPRRRRPSRSRRRSGSAPRAAATRIAATAPFMSYAPRP